MIVDLNDTAIIWVNPDLLYMAHALPCRILGSVNSEDYAPAIGLRVLYPGGLGRTHFVTITQDGMKTVIDISPPQEALQ